MSLAQLKVISEPSDEVTGINDLIVDNLEIWTSAIKKKSSAGRGGGSKRELYGIKKLRALILELAVRGLLVPQDPNDEPASELLKKIAAEKAKLMKEGPVKKQKSLPPLNQEKTAFSLPAGWEWSRIAEIAEIAPRNDVGNDVDVSFISMPLITTSYDGSHQQEIRKWSEVKNGYTHFSDGDIAIAKITPCFENSKAAIFTKLKNGVGAGTTELHVARPFGEYIDRKFILLYLKTPQFLLAGETKMTGSAGQKRVPKDFFALNPLPLPPFEEQHRIVAKVDELMALCDQLEQQTESSLTVHQTLVETLLGALTNAENHTAFQQTWQHIAQYFDTLFTTEHSIDQLKQTILQLAVQGKLVPQDPNDEPASELYKRLQGARDVWLRETSEVNPESKTMLKKLKKLEEPKEPYPLPSSWACVHLIQLCRMLVDCHNKTAPYVESGIPIVRTTNIKDRNFITKELRYVDQKTYEYWSRRCPPEERDIIFTREAPMGEAVIIPAGARWCLGQRTMLIRPMHEFVSSQYLLLALTEPHLLERASENAVGLTVKHLRVGDVENLNIPLPPIKEQNRIVAKVNELMDLCDQLKSHIHEAQTIQLYLADAVADKSLYQSPPVAKKKSGEIKLLSKGFARQVLAAEILCRYNNGKMTQMKLQKLIHLVEYHAELDEIQGRYQRQAAGPYDNQMMYGLATSLKKQKWFAINGRTQNATYSALENVGKHRDYLHHWKAQMSEIDKVLDLLGKAEPGQCEIVSTLYAAWNDLLIDQVEATDERIIAEASDPKRWHQAKAMIDSEKWPKALNWMREKGLIPNGFGLHTVSKK